MRARVYRAAIELIVSNGYDTTTMDDIADRADVARGTVFNHFDRKTAFLDEWAHTRRRIAIAAVHADRLDGRSSADILTRYMRELARLSTETRTETVAVMSAAAQHMVLVDDPPLGRELATYVEQGQAAGEIRPEIDARQAGALLALGYFAALTGWIRVEPSPYDLEARLLSLMALFLRGVEQPHAADRSAVLFSDARA